MRYKCEREIRRWDMQKLFFIFSDLFYDTFSIADHTAPNDRMLDK
jgi:hypothetical protein